MGETVAIIFTALIVLASVLLLVTGTFYVIFNLIESVYLLAFNKPIYVHFYPVRKELRPDESHMLEKEFSFYKKLSERQKQYFRHRVHRFILQYKFIGRQGLEPTPDIALKIAATWVMLTFGMRSYLPKIFEAIIIYPDIFESRNGNMHKGEFNPMAKAVVFSWKHFEEGHAFESDNLNLGLHEFAHVLHLNCTAIRRPGASGMVYTDMFEKVLDYIDHTDNRNNLMALGYFRAYAYTNNHEFVAVVLEHFFETPQEFRQKLPELYGMISKMINHKPLQQTS